MKATLFDKIINLHFRRTDGTSVDLLTPPTGRKPTIRVSGRWVMQDVLLQTEIRITNFVTDVPLSYYGTINAPGYISLEAGYVGNVIKAFQGQVQNSFQELPGPDGVTTFQMLIGNATEWMSVNHKGSYAEGTSVKSILGDLANSLGVSLQYSGPDYQIPVGVSLNCLAKDWFPKLRQILDQSNFVIEPFGDKIVAFTQDQGGADGNGGTDKVHRLDYISHANHSASGFNIQAPWIPGIIPGDTIEIDPNYFRQDFGGSTVSPGNHFVVYMVDFEFSTVDDANMMTILTVGAQA